MEEISSLQFDPEASDKEKMVSLLGVIARGITELNYNITLMNNNLDTLVENS